MNTRQKVLEDALKCVNGEREKQYGNPEDNFKRISKLWSDYLSMLFDDVVIELEPIDVAKMMVLFKIARSMGSQDKMDNYVDMIGYSACAAEILEKETKMAESRSCSKKASDNIRDFFEQVAPGTVTNKEAFEEHFTAQPCDHIEVADECRVCDYAEKCAGTGVCLKDTEKKCLKDKPDYKCNRDTCGQFDACMIAYQHYICNKTKETSEAIDECMCEQKRSEEYNDLHPRLKPAYVMFDTDAKISAEDRYKISKTVDDMVAKALGKKGNDKKEDQGSCYHASFWHTYNKISEYITSSSCKVNVNPIDVADHLICNGHAPTEMTALLMAGELGFDDVTDYVNDAINQLKKDNKNASNN